MKTGVDCSPHCVRHAVLSSSSSALSVSLLFQVVNTLKVNGVHLWWPLAIAFIPFSVALYCTSHARSAPKYAKVCIFSSLFIVALVSCLYYEHCVDLVHLQHPSRSALTHWLHQWN